uniref:TldD/PmbA family protein n=1 Tax=Thermofilum pendens TaxID=2269 RepID=A0A7C3WPI3_THEPE
MSELLEIGVKLRDKALREGFEEAAVLVTHTESLMVKFANSEPSVVQRWSSREAGVYLAKNQRILGTSLPASSLEEAYRLIGELYSLHAKVPPSMLYAPLPEPEKPQPLEGLVDKKLVEVLHEPSSVSEAIVEAALRQSIDYFAGMFQVSYERKALVTSKGVELEEEATSLKMYIRSFAGEGSGQWALGSRRFDLRRVEDVASTASRLAFESRRQEDVPPGKYDVILSPMVVGNLFNIVADMATATSILMGTSIFTNKAPGDKVASDQLTMIDVPRNSELPGSTAFDDEGVPTYSKPIIEKGVFANILHNTKTAAKFGARSTGNAGLVFPKVWALEVVPGDYSLEEMLREVKEGLVITNNWYTRLQNYVEGIFSTITRDAVLIVKNGEVAGAARKMRIADALPRMLINIAAVGREVYDIHWWEVDTPTRAPYILFKEVNTSKHTA